jgi:hypothetical protein
MLHKPLLDVFSWLAGVILLSVGGYFGAMNGGLGGAIAYASIGALVGFSIPAVVSRFREVSVVALILVAAAGVAYLGYRLWCAI